MTSQKSKSPLFLILSVLIGGGLIYWAMQHRSTPDRLPNSVTSSTTPSNPPANPPAEAANANPPSTAPQATTEAAPSSAPAPTPSNPPASANAAASPKYDISQIPTPPQDSQEKFVEFMQEKRGEDPQYLKLRYQRAQNLLANKDLYRDKETKAFLLTPREKFVRKQNLSRAYDHAFLDIGYGVTISGPFLVGRMTSSIDVQPGDKVLEIGTGSGYQSAVLSYLTDQVYTIEIIEPLAKQSDQIYSDLTAATYPEYGNIKRKADDGYFGWAEYAPFDKIIVTCGIDHIPPELLKQLKVGGIMVIPVGPPGAQVVLKVTKQEDSTGNITVTREDIYGGRKKVPFVPFTKKDGGTWNQ